MNSKARVACNFDNLFENEGLFKVAAVTFTVNVVLSRNWCQIRSLLLQT